MLKELFVTGLIKLILPSLARRGLCLFKLDVQFASLAMPVTGTEFLIITVLAQVEVLLAYACFYWLFI